MAVLVLMCSLCLAIALSSTHSPLQFSSYGHSVMCSAVQCSSTQLCAHPPHCNLYLLLRPVVPTTTTTTTTMTTMTTVGAA